MLVITLERNLQNFPLFKPPESTYKELYDKILEDTPDEKSKDTWLLRMWKKVCIHKISFEEMIILTGKWTLVVIPQYWGFYFA